MQSLNRSLLSMEFKNFCAYIERRTKEEVLYMPKFGISTYSIRTRIEEGEWTPEQAIAWIGSRGAEVTEIVPFVIDMAADPSLVDRCLRAADDSGVKIDNFSQNAVFLRIPQDAYEAELKRVKEAIDIAGRLGVSTMRIDMNSVRRPAEEATTEDFIEDFPLIVDTYKRLCDYAQRYGFKILLENHMYFVNGSERTAAILHAMRGYNFGAQLDVGNFACVDERPEIAVEKNVGYAAVVHMKDFYRRSRDQDPGYVEAGRHGRPWLRTVRQDYLRGSIVGQGDLDIRRILSVIKDSGFDGSFFVEYEGIEDCEYGTALSFDNLLRLYREA